MLARPARRALLAALGTLLASLAVIVVPAGAAGASADAEADLVQRVNAARAAHRLPALAVAGDLTSVARAHAQRMASTGRLYHNPDLARQVANWSSLAENVGYAGTSVQVHDALMASAGHRANILSSTSTQVGVGAVVAGGRLWVTQVFRKPAGGFPVGGGIGQTWAQFSALLGPALTPEHDVRGGRAQQFAGGEVLWSSTTGAREVHGGILGKYRQLGGAWSPLGLPTTHEHDAPYSRRNRFQWGQVVWSSRTGANAVYGGIGERYDAVGGPGGPLGLPTADEQAVTGGRMSPFERGRIYWSTGSGAHEVYGGIAIAYLANGGPGGRLGFPVTGEYGIPGGRRSDFQRGSITWNATTGALTVTAR